jgi:hypothetical protein
VKLGDLVKTPGLKKFYTNFDWEDRIGLIIGFDNRPASKGFAIVFIPDCDYCIFSVETLELISEAR